MYHQGWSLTIHSDLLFNINLAFLCIPKYPYGFKITKAVLILINFRLFCRGRGGG